MLFYTIARQKVALNGLYNTDNNMGEPMCPPILLSGLVMLSEGLAKNQGKGKCNSNHHHSLRRAFPPREPSFSFLLSFA